MATRLMRAVVPQQVRRSQRGNSRRSSSEKHLSMPPTSYQRHQNHYQLHHQPNSNHLREHHSPYFQHHRHSSPVLPSNPAVADDDDDDDDNGDNIDIIDIDDHVRIDGENVVADSIASGLLERSSPTWHPMSECGHSLGRALWSRGTWDDPMPIASVTDERVVACTGISPGAASGNASAPHPTTWITVTTCHPRQCPDCGQVFKLERRRCDVSSSHLTRKLIGTHDGA